MTGVCNKDDALRIGRPEAIFRGDCLFYLLFKGNSSLNGAIHASISFADLAITVPVVNLHHIDQKRSLFAVCLPLLPDDDTIEITLVHTTPSGGSALIRKWTYTGKKIKWLSRLHYRMKSSLTAHLKECDRQISHANAFIQPLGVFPFDQQDLVVRVNITIPATQATATWSWGCTVSGKAPADPLILMKDMVRTIEGREVRSLVLSQRIPKTTKSLVFHISDETHTHLGFAMGFIPESLNGWLQGFFDATEDASSDPRYPAWLLAHRATPDELQLQKENPPATNALFSIIVPISTPMSTHLAETIRSVQAQSYPHWELILSGWPLTNDPTPPSVPNLDDDRIKCIEAAEGAGVVEKMNAGISYAHGDYIAFLEQDDLLEPDTLYAYAQAVDADSEADVLYCDEDTYETGTRTCSDPRFKTNFDPDLLYSYNYIDHFLAVSKQILERITLPEPQLEGAQYYDLTLKATDAARQIIHIPRVLYHQRKHLVSSQNASSAISPAVRTRQKVLEDHFARKGILAKVLTTETPSVYQTYYEPDISSAKISIVIPNKDHIDYLGPCLRSIFATRTSVDLEILIIENNSHDAETFAYYDQLTREYPSQVKVLHFNGEFNYSKIINFGAAAASGTHLLLLNNDTTIISPDFFETMLGYFERPEVGVVGPLILFEDGLVQEAGMALMEEGWMGFLNQNHSPVLYEGYLGCLSCNCNVSAVLGACQMVKTDLFRELGGYDESLAVTYNDVDFCWRVREANKLIVYSPYVKITHKEYGSRGADDRDASRIRQTGKEAQIMRDKWPNYFAFGDPFINPNLDQNSPYSKLGDSNA